jgi:hypothetical protein
MPVVEMRPVIDVPIPVAIAAAPEDGRGTEAAPVDCHAAASEPAAMECSAAASESAAVKPATAEATAMETTASAAAKTAASTTAAMTAMPDFGRQIVGCKFC